MKTDSEINAFRAGRQCGKTILTTQSIFDAAKAARAANDGGYCDEVLVILRKPKDIATDRASIVASKS